MNNKTLATKIIYSLAIIIPLAVALLTQIKISGYDFSFLPKIYAVLNGFTAILLIFALIFILQKKIKLHEILIQIAMGFSGLFLVLYVLYHATSEPTSYQGTYPKIYYSILISHIILSSVVIPLVLFAFLYGKNHEISKHQKIVKWAYPIWLYVAVTGVCVYWMIADFY